VIALVVTAGGVVAAAALGWALDWLLALGCAGPSSAGGDPRRFARWPLRAVAALAALAAVLAHPAVLAAALLAAGAARLVRARRGARAPSPGARASFHGADAQNQPEAARAVAVGLAFALVAATALALARPGWPLYWDEFVWLAKARLAAVDGVATLRRLALTPGSEVIPPGYPITYPAAAALFSGGAAVGGAAGDPGRLLLGAAAVELVTVALLFAVVAGRFARRPRALAVGAGLIFAAPLVVVHLRATYADLPVGALATALALLLDARRVPVAVPTAVALALVGLKDEGMVHVVAVALGVALGRRRGAWLARAGVLVLAAAAPVVVWRATVAAHGVGDLHHRLALPAWASLGPLLARLAAHAVDVASFGPLVAAFVGAALAPVARRLLGRRGAVPGAARRALVVALAQLVLTVAAVGLSPGRVHEFALSGTLFGRLLVQLAPSLALAAALPLGAVLGDDADGTAALDEEAE
jgi:hypothetical protein